MATVTIFLLCSFVVAFAQGEVTLQADRPWLRVKLSDTAALKCCYKSVKPDKLTWVRRVQAANNTFATQNVERSDRVTTEDENISDIFCGKLTIKSVQLNDYGMYQCHLNGSNLFTYGTYLQVYKPMEKTINLSESTKNKILTAEGILLVLCVLVPSATLLCKSKKLRELEKKKVQREAENIYQGLNLDDCCTTYDQIERSHGRGPYQDVGNIMEEGDEIQLEKP